MTEATAVDSAPPLSLFQRVVGVITSPAATFKSIVAHPRPFGVLFLCALVIGVATAVPQFSESAQQAAIDMQIKANPQMNDQQIEGMRRMAPYFGYFTLAGVLIFTPIMTMFFTALYWALFNVVLGGQATFKQVLAVVSHAMVIMALGLVAGLPFMLNSPTMAMGGPFNLGALVPMLEADSTIARLLSALSPFSIWSTFVNAVGLAVLYRRGVAGIFAVLMGVYLVFAYLGTLFRG